MFIHIVMLKLRSGFLNPGTIEQIENLYDEIKIQTPGIEEVHTYTNCFEREENYDLLIKLYLNNMNVLPEYMSSSKHMQFIALVEPYMISKAIIDYDNERNESYEECS